MRSPGVALAAGMSLGDVDRGELRDLVPVASVLSPDLLAARPTTAFAEFPASTRSQRRMFHRLNWHH